MSADALPIDPAAFAEAIESLPVDALHSKAAEIYNSITHMRSSNEQLIPFADAGDQDCKDALYDNLATLNRMNNRIGLLRTEVEKRGMRWQFDDSNGTIANDTIVNDASDASYGQHIEQNGGDTPRINANSADIGTATTNGRLTDAELVAQIEARMSEHENEGVHL